MEAIEGRSINERNHAKANTIACKLSHVKAIKAAEERGWNYVIIFEDDIYLPKNFDEKLNVLFSHAPENWNMLFLHGTFGKQAQQQRYNQHWAKVNELYGAFAYVIHSNFYETAINKIMSVTAYKGVDDIYSMLMPANNIYRAIEPCVFHKAGYSVRENRIVKAYKHLEPQSEA